MTNFIAENIFLLMALISGTLASLSGAIVGTYVVIKRISFLAGSLSHAVLGGLGVFLFFQKSFGLAWLSPIFGAIFTAIFCALILAWGHYRFKEREDTLISIIWTLGMSVGIIFLSITPGTNVDVLNYLFGNLLWTSFEDAYVLGALFLLSLVFHLRYHSQLVLMSFDEKQATLSGINCKKLFTSLLIMVGLVIIFLIKTVGAILVMSMLTLPTATVCHFAKNVKNIVYQSMALGTIYAIAGVLIANIFDWPLGASITLIASLGYALVKLGAFKILHRANLFPKRS